MGLDNPILDDSTGIQQFFAQRLDGESPKGFGLAYTLERLTREAELSVTSLADRLIPQALYFAVHISYHRSSSVVRSEYDTPIYITAKAIIYKAAATISLALLIPKYLISSVCVSLSYLKMQPFYRYRAS